MLSEALLVGMLTEAVGGESAYWSSVIGNVEVLSLATHPRCNWTAVPDGSDEEIGAVYKAIDLVRQEHPHARM
jgi:hypothetical protein